LKLITQHWGHILERFILSGKIKSLKVELIDQQKYFSHTAALLLVIFIELPAHVIYKTIVNDGEEYKLVFFWNRQL
jgi:hypothetical protein